MKQDFIYCYTHEDEYPYEVWYFTEKQKNKKCKYFQSIEQVKAWCRKHKTAKIESASWQVFAVRNGLT